MILAEWLMDKSNRDLTWRLAQIYGSDWGGRIFMTDLTKHRRNKENYDALPSKTWTDTWSDIFIIAQQILNESSK